MSVPIDSGTNFEEEFKRLSLSLNGPRPNYIDNPAAVIIGTNPETIVDEKFTQTGTTLISSLHDVIQFNLAVAGKDCLAIDAEGVDLSRMGTLTVFSVGVQVLHGVHVFLFDIIHTDYTLRAAQLSSLKYVLENQMILKIIHDCRQDSDALYYQQGIILNNVFDTSIFVQSVANSNRRVNLNTALQMYGCTVNQNRDMIFDMYKAIPNFWGVRPVTQFMIEYASQDVASLFDLRNKLLARIASEFPTYRDDMFWESSCAPDIYRSNPFCAVVPVPQDRVGLVIGRGGSGIDQLERRTGALISCKINGPSGPGFLILAPSPQILQYATQQIIAVAYDAHYY